MHYLWVSLPLVIFLIDGLSAFNGGADDLVWEMRWRSLDRHDQARILAASRSKESRAKLEEQGELGLAEGFDRRERRRRSYVQLPVLLLIVAVLVFTLVGVLPKSDLDQLFSLSAGLIFVGTWLRDWQVRRTYRAPV